jgi:hypothetical protein
MQAQGSQNTGNTGYRGHIFISHNLSRQSFIHSKEKPGHPEMDARLFISFSFSPPKQTLLPGVKGTNQAKAKLY